MKELKWVNIFKGIGIIAVVIGHVYDGDIRRYIYMFHMPLFFFLSGYLLKPNNDYKCFLLKKSKSLLIPYVAFLVPIYLISYGLPSANLSSVFEYFKRPIIGGQLLQVRLGVFWFITCLFLTQQLVNFIITKFKESTTILIMFGLFTLGYLNSTYLPEFSLPWNANTVLMSAPIFYSGFWYKKLKIEINNIVILVLGGIVVIGSYNFPNNMFDMKYNNFGYPFITLLCAIILILNIKIISIYLSKVGFLERIIGALGKASMIIMYLHITIIYSARSHLSVNKFLVTTLSIIVSYLIYILLNKFQITKALFLGNVLAFDSLKNKILKK